MNLHKRALVVALVLTISRSSLVTCQDLGASEFSVVAYYRGHRANIERYAVEKLTHINYSFLHLRGNELFVDESRDGTTIRTLVALKRKHPGLKIILSFGGWGGCATCSDVFSTDQGRKEFAESVRRILEGYGADGIDLDWEYPAIEGYPGHRFSPADKHNFTLLVLELRQCLGDGKEVTFAAGGLSHHLGSSIEWKEVVPLVDRVYVMTYDLVSGFDPVSGHHTPLYSTPRQRESADFAVGFLDSLGVPRRKIVIGAAFYARTWELADTGGNGLFQQGTFKNYVPYKDFDRHLTRDNGFVFFWDSVAHAPYAYSVTKRLFATFDDLQSVAHKTRYAVRNGLGGIMFWELTGDRPENGLLDAIDGARNAKLPSPPGSHQE
jgi:chitinase